MTEGNIFSGLKVVDFVELYCRAGRCNKILTEFRSRTSSKSNRLRESCGERDRRFPLRSPIRKSLIPFNCRIEISVALRLISKLPSAQQVLERLAKWADVFIVNTPHSARQKLKLEYEDVARCNPRLIYADLTSFGEKGPDAALAGFDLTAFWARSGLLFMTRDAGEPPDLAGGREW